MDEVSRKRLLITIFSSALTNLVFAVAGYFVAVGGGIPKPTAAIFAVSLFVLTTAGIASTAYNYARNPNYQPRSNTKFYFWFFVPLILVVYIEMFYLVAGALLAALVGILAAGGIAVPEVVIASLFWVSMLAGLTFAGLAIRWAWKQFKPA